MVPGLQVLEEKVYDLLPNVKSRPLPIGPRRALNVREDAHGRAYVDGLTEVSCLLLTPPLPGAGLAKLCPYKLTQVDMVCEMPFGSCCWQP